MAKYGEWNMKGASLSDDTAQREYGIERDFIVKGVRAGKLEWRHSCIHGNPIVRLLRSQIEALIVEELGSDYLARQKAESELREIKKEMGSLRTRLNLLQLRKAELETLLGLPAASEAAQKQPAKRKTKSP